MVMACQRYEPGDVSKTDESSIVISPAAVHSFLEMVKSNGRRNNFLFVSYLVFITGFFFLRSVKIHNNVFYALILVPYLFTIPWGMLKLLFRSKIFQSTLILLAYLMATFLWGERGTPWDYLQEIIRCLSLLTFFAVTSELAFRHSGFPRFLIALICCIAALAPYLLLLNPHFVIPLPPQRLNDLGALRNAVQIGNVYGMVILLIYFSIIQQEKFIRALPSVLLMAAVLPVFLLAQSRGPIVGLYITLLLGGLFTRDSKLLFMLCCITLLGAIYLSAGHGFLYDMIITRGDSYRIEIFQATMSLIEKKMFFGHGILKAFSHPLSNGIIIKHPHNLYLATWLHGGLVGLILLIVFMIRAFWEGLRVFLQEGDFTYVALLLYASICVFTGLDKVIHQPHPIYMFFWLPLGLLTANEMRRHFRDQSMKDQRDTM
jgi:O-antigen ligase